MKNFSPITFPPLDGAGNLSTEIYNGLRADTENSKHGARFLLRELDLTARPNGTPSPFDVSNAHLGPAENVDDTHREELVALASSLVMKPEDWQALVGAFKTVYQDDAVKAHRESGGAVKFIDSHLTYTGQVIQQLASWQALIETGTEAPHEIQTTIVSRATTLFRLTLLQDILEAEGKTHYGGAIIDDLLLKFGGAILTIPSSRSGNRLVQMISGGIHARKPVVERAKTSYERVLNRGGPNGQILFEGSSGAENEKSEDGSNMIIGEVSERTAELTTDYNQTRYAERVMAIGVFMESNPYTGNPENPIAPSDTPFVFLRPMFPISKDEFDAIMHTMAVQGTRIKKSRNLPYTYGSGQIPKVQPIPEVWIEHSV